MLFWKPSLPAGNHKNNDVFGLWIYLVFFFLGGKTFSIAEFSMEVNLFVAVFTSVNSVFTNSSISDLILPDESTSLNLSLAFWVQSWNDLIAFFPICWLTFKFIYSYPKWTCLKGVVTVPIEVIYRHLAGLHNLCNDLGPTSLRKPTLIRPKPPLTFQWRLGPDPRQSLQQSGPLTAGACCLLVNFQNISFLYIHVMMV